jgi:hypothetical protein
MRTKVQHSFILLPNDKCKILGLFYERILKSIDCRKADTNLVFIYSPMGPRGFLKVKAPRFRDIGIEGGRLSAIRTVFTRYPGTHF